jgi:crotonobetainyl-CoA:carnitine CoA-transferase CaiB-like acyl-CoA transferase
MKLSGLKVLDLSLFLPGPHLTMMMADHGAEVIKIEPPGEGEPVRHVGLREGEHTVWFRNTHRGKRSVVLNLKDDADRAKLIALAKTADVFVEAFRPGVVARLGIDHATLRALNPRLVYCSIAAFGQTGPWRDKPAHDLAIQALAGTLSVNLGNDNEPCNPNVPAADMAASLMALAGILMALYRREQTGQGDYLDLSMHDALTAWLPNVMGPVFAQDRAPVVKHERSWGGSAFYRIYRTADQKHLALGGSEFKFAKNLLTALQREDLIDLMRHPPGPLQDPVKAALTQIFATRALAEWETFLTPIDCCWAPVYSLHEALGSEQVAARQMRLRDRHGHQSLGVPIRFLNEPAQPNLAAPDLGADVCQWSE